MAEETRYARRKRRKEERALSDAVADLMPEDRQTPSAPRRVPSRRAGTVKRGEPTKNLTVSDRWATIVKNVRAGEYTWEEFCQGLTPAELARAQLMDVDRTFRGRPPTWIPREFHLQCQRELHRRFNEKMQAALLGATTQYIQLAKDIGDPAVQERMLRYIMERVMGPIPKEVRVSATPEHEHFLAGVVRKEGTVDRSKRYSKRTEEIPDEDYEDEDG